MRILVFLSAWLLAFAAGAGELPSGGQAAPSPVLTPAELKAALASPSVTVIDIRPPAEYQQGHIAGALSAPYGSWRGPAHSPGTLPPIETLTAQVRKLGLTPERHAVVVSSGADVTDFGAAARVYWTLKYLGLNRLSILNGGIQAWQQARQPLSQEPSPAPAPSLYEPKLNTAIIATRSDVVESLGSNDSRLIDARPGNFFEGLVKAPTASVPGTIAGAKNVPHSVWFAPGSNQIVSAAEARVIAVREFPDVAADNIAFCNTGHWAATDWFALSELAGVPNVRMYPESLADWTNADEPLPMANTPGRASQIADKFKKLFGKS